MFDCVNNVKSGCGHNRFAIELKLSLLFIILISSIPGTANASAEKRELFNGELGSEWNELAAFGGNFNQFAKIENQQLVVKVPKGNSWGKTGIRSANALVKMPESEDNFATKINFEIDPERSSNFILALIPSNWNGNLEWRSHHVRVELSSHEGDKDALLTLWIKQQEMMSTKVELAQLKNISIILRPDRLVLVTDGTENILLQGYIRDNLPIYKAGYLISALASAPKSGMAANFVLRAISMEKRHYEREKPSSDPSVWLDKSQQAVLFDGRILDKRWVKYRAHGGDFDQHAQLKDGALVIDVPENSKWGQVGIMSPEPLVWLDKFTDSAETALTFTFDPEKTTGIMIGLAAEYGLNGNDPSKPRFTFHWRRTAAGKILATSAINQKDNLIEAELTDTTLNQVNIILTAKGVKVEAEGFPTTLSPWSELVTGQSFRVYAYSLPDTTNQPVKMGLKKILLKRKAGVETLASMPVDQAKTLPVNVLFNGKPNNAWERASVSGDAYLHYSQFENNQLIVHVPEKKSDRDNSGLLSTKPVLNLDDRVLTTSHKITVKVDPKKTSGFQIMFRGSKVTNMWGQHLKAAVSFIRLTDGINAGKHMLSLRRNDGPYGVWRRAIDSKWVDQYWDGTLELENGNQWMEARIPGGPSVRGTGFSLKNGSDMFMTIYSYSEKNDSSRQLALERIESGWVTPANMNRVTRWHYIDVDDFDAAAFIQDLVDELPYPNAELRQEEQK